MLELVCELVRALIGAVGGLSLYIRSDLTATIIKERTIWNTHSELKIIKLR